MDKKFSSLTKKYGIFIILIAIIVISSVISPYFMKYNNILSIARQVSVTGILALGETLLIISGMIDLSMGSVLALSGMVSINAYLASESFIVAFLVSILIAALAGLINGILVTKVKIPAFIATMSMDFIARGSVYLYTGGKPIYQIGNMGKISSGYLGPIPIPVIFLLFLVIICWFILSYTTLGRSIYAVGGNASAAKASGINVDRIRIIAYVISGIFVGIAGVLQMGRLNSGLPDTGIGYHGDAIASTVIGGTSFTGGIGTAQGTLAGTFIIGIISNILNLQGVQSYTQQIVKGGIIIAAVGIDLINKSRQIKVIKRVK